MIRPLASVLRAAAFLTRLPAVPGAFAGPPVPLGHDAPAFPVVGLAAAAVPALVLLGLAHAGLSPLAAAALATLLLVALTGALHEDGLGDTADGLFGHADKARALAIMKDSRVGTYGALALTGALLLRVSLLADIATGSGAHAALALLAAATASRGAMALLWSMLPSADPGGLADRMGRPSALAGRAAALIGLVLASALAAPAFGWASLLLPPFLGALAFAALRGVLVRRLGGQTGDTLGACQQITEIAGSSASRSSRREREEERQAEEKIADAGEESEAGADVARPRLAPPRRVEHGRVDGEFAVAARAAEREVQRPAQAASGQPALGERWCGPSASAARRAREAAVRPSPIQAASTKSPAVRRAGIQLAPSSSRAAAHPKARWRSLMWPIMESAVFSIL